MFTSMLDREVEICTHEPVGMKRNDPLIQCTNEITVVRSCTSLDSEVLYGQL